MNVWVDVFTELFSARYALVTVISMILSARYAYVSWYKRRRVAFVESARRDAIIELERAADPRDHLLVTALANRDAEGVRAVLLGYSLPETLGVTQARRYVELDSAAIAYFDTHFVVTGAISGSLLILLTHAIGAFVGETHDERRAALEADARLKVIQTVQMVQHIDSASGHTVVLVIYRPDSVTAATVGLLGAAAKGGHGQPVEFYPVACCVTHDSATAYFARSRLPYRQRFMAGRSDWGTFATMRALGAGTEPGSSGGYMTVIDPQGNVTAHWNSLPDASELRETLH